VITGIVIADAAADFARLQRQQTWSRLGRRLHLRPASELLAFDQVVGKLGRTGQRELGLHTVEIDTIIGSVDRVGDFDRWFRPRPPVDRQRWIDLDRVGRAGAIIPPIEVYRVGHLHFVRDGHHRVSVARAHGQRSIDAYVTEVTTPSSHHPIAVPPPNPDTTSRRRFTRRVEGTGVGRSQRAIMLRSPWTATARSARFESADQTPWHGSRHPHGVRAAASGVGGLRSAGQTP
jgi:hypothetical protein